MDELREKLFYEQKNGYDLIDTAERVKCEEYCAEYMRYLDASRTEREAVKNAIAEAEERGFTEYVPGMALKPGMKIYQNNRGKALTLAVIGRKSLAEGAVIAGAHVDAPRLDLKQVPLYESDELCYFRTHYYGGIKKYQWVTIPLELHGVASLRDGSCVEITIGREKDEPKFVITDLLPHLAADQMKKTMAEGITGEGLNILIGSVPYADEGKDRVKLAVLSLLNDLCGVTEEDFLSADVTNAFDPIYPEVSEKRSESKINYGMGICKFTGARGKAGSSDASAELVGYLRRLFAAAGVVWQMAELGKVDQGGGGTIAKFMAKRNIDTIDAGVPVLSMHAPFEVVSKFDCYMTYKGVLAAYAEKDA